MKKTITLFLISFLVLACQDKETNFTLNGKVDGLRKGTLYLQRVKDSFVIDLDSIHIRGEESFSLKTNLKEPEILFVYLDKGVGENSDNIVEIFAEPGTLNFKTDLKEFSYNAKIEGSTNHKLLQDYFAVIKKFNDERLDIVEASFKAYQDQDEEETKAIQKKFNQLLKRKYLYTVNFAINNKDYEVAPYIMITEAFDANVKYLDTVYNSLPKPIKKSRYGKTFKNLIKERKKLSKLEEKK